MSTRTELNEAALNMTKLLTLLTGLNDDQVDTLLVNQGPARRLKKETLNMLRYAEQAKEEGYHLP